MADTLLGYPLPFPREDLYIALIAVTSFIPAVILINALVNGAITLFSRVVGTAKPKSQ